MLKCKFCGKEFSMTVINLHKKRCFKNPKNKIEEVKEVKKESNKKGAK